MNMTTSTSALATGSNGITLTLLGVPTAQGSLTISGVSNKGSVFYGPADPPLGPDIPPSPTTQAAGTNPETVSGSLSPTITFTNNSGINSAVSALLAADLGSGRRLATFAESSGISAAGAQVAGLSANCGSVSLVQ